MTRLLFLIIATLSLFNPAKADTIDYWYVLVNDSLFGVYTQFSKGEIDLKVKDINKEDTLIIYFMSDAPCSDCVTQVMVESGGEVLAESDQGEGNDRAIKIPLKPLARKAGSGSFLVRYYQHRNSVATAHRVFLFTLKLE